jgi:hypothetical protein
MFNEFLSDNYLFFLTLFSFFLFFTIRQLLVKRKIFVFLYHIGLFSLLFIAYIGGAGIKNDGYDRLEEFILLEKNNELELARKNPENYDSMLQIDLQEFKNADEFRGYLKRKDTMVDKAGAISIGWLFALVSDISMALIQMLSYVYKIRNKRRL